MQCGVLCANTYYLGAVWREDQKRTGLTDLGLSERPACIFSRVSSVTAHLYYLARARIDCVFASYSLAIWYLVVLIVVFLSESRPEEASSETRNVANKLLHLYLGQQK